MQVKEYELFYEGNLFACRNRPQTSRLPRYRLCALPRRYNESLKPVHHGRPRESELPLNDAVVYDGCFLPCFNVLPE